MKIVMKRLIYSIIILLVSIVNPAFSDDEQTVLCRPEKIIIDKELYLIEVEPIQISFSEGWGPKHFRLKFLNKHSKNIEILWGSTCYLKNGDVNGIFCEYKGKAMREKETILPGQSIDKNIAPENLSRLHLTPASFFKTGFWWYHKEMPIGKNGVLLNMLIDGQKTVEQAEIDFILK